MLTLVKRWHIAPQLAPSREAKFLYLTSSNPSTPGGAGTSPPPPDPLAPTVNYAGQGLDAQGNPIDPNAPVSPIDGINAEQAQTRRAVAGTLETDDDMATEGGEEREQSNTEEEPPLRTREVLEEVTEACNKMQNLQERMNACNAHARQVLKGEQLKRWNEDANFVSTFVVETTSWKLFLEQIAEFETGKMPRHVLLDVIGDYCKTETFESGMNWNDVHRNILKTMHDRNIDLKAERRAAPKNRIKKYFGRTDSAATGNESTRIMLQQPAIEDFKNIVGLQSNFLIPIQARCAALMSAIKESQIESNITRMADPQSELNEGSVNIYGQTRAYASNVLNSMYSFYDIYKAGKGIIDTYKEAFEQSARLKQARLEDVAGKFLAWLPYGQDVEQILHANNEKKNDEVKHSYVEYLKSRKIGFRELFLGAGSLMDLNKSDPNRGRAVLEYAASKGWLYNLYTEETKEVGERMVFAKWKLADLVPTDWEHSDIDNYYSELLSENGQGETAESESAYKRIQKRENTQAFIQNIHIELHNLNFWAVEGICKRAVERGLAAEVGPWLGVTILSWLRDHPEYAKFLNTTFFDRIGALSMYSTSQTLGWLKADRENLEKWAQTGTSNITEAGTLGKVISQIEEEIKTKSQRKFTTADDRKLLDRFVSRVLTGEILTSETKDLALSKDATISIFASQYNKYRAEFQRMDGKPSTPRVPDHDPDYYVQKTDTLLTGEEMVGDILEGNRGGGLTNKDKALPWIANIIDLYKELEKKGMRDAAENLRTELGRKITKAIVDGVLTDSRAGSMASLNIKIKSEGKKLMMKTMVERGLLDVGALVKGVWKGWQGTWAKEVLQQYDRTLAGELDKLVKKKDKGDPAEITREYRALLNKFYSKQEAGNRPITWKIAQEDLMASSKKRGATGGEGAAVNDLSLSA